MKIHHLLLSLAWVLQTALAVQFDKLVANNKNNAVRINDKNYNSLMNNEDFTLVVYLTASNPQIGCVLCRDFQPLYDSLASSYFENLHRLGRTEEDGKLVLAVADFIDSRKMFQEISLNNVPKLFLYKPGKGRTFQPDSEYQFVASESTAPVVAWIRQNVAINKDLFHIIKKINYSELVVTALAVIGTVGLIAQHYKKIAKLAANKRGWQGFCIILIVLFTSGYMFNVIRNTPYTRTNSDGSKQYFQGGHQTQIGIETQIVSVIYGFFTLAMIVLVDKLGRLSSPKLKVAGSIGLSVVVFLLYSALVTCFHSKNLGYPYWLLKF